jgi:protein arginine N-methyltransferase 2
MDSLEIKNLSLGDEEHTKDKLPLPPSLPNNQSINSYSYQQYQENDPWQNWEYFRQYGKLDIHAEMLKDESRTKTYREAIKSHAKQFHNKIVLDVGCGTGILSFFAIEAGAAKVYAVEASNLADWTELVVSSNNLSDKIIVIKGKIEEITLPEKVDIIISEWMGTFLIFESMLESILFARDYLLKKGGFLFPSDANIYLSPISMDELYKEKILFWEKVYDIDMSAFIPFAKKCSLEKPIIDKPLNINNLLSSAVVIKSFELKTVPNYEPYEKTIKNFLFKITKAGNFHGFASWFDVIFRVSADDKNSIVLSTSPEFKDTHWHQILFMFDDPIYVEEGTTIKGTIRYQRNPELLRHLIIEINFYIIELQKYYAKKFYLWGIESF